MIEFNSVNLTDLRYERKISILNGGPAFIVQQLYSMNFYEEYFERRVSSIYYDTIDLKSYRQNIDGVFGREKYRIRYYDESPACSLEIKVKRGLLMGKIVFPIDPHSNYLMENPEIGSKLFREYSDDYLKPIVLVSYLRRYFINSLGVCVTIDTDISSSLFINSAKSAIIKNFYDVVEFKYPPDLDDYFRYSCFPKFSAAGYRLSKSSKYVRAVMQKI